MTSTLDEAIQTLDGLIDGGPRESSSDAFADHMAPCLWPIRDLLDAIRGASEGMLETLEDARLHNLTDRSVEMRVASWLEALGVDFDAPVTRGSWPAEPPEPDDHPRLYMERE